MEEREFANNTLVKHFKGKYYTFLCKAVHTETGEWFAVYRAEYGDRTVYVRPYSMFISKVDKEKYPNCSQEFRFEPV